MRARGRLLSCLVTVVIALAGFVTAGALPAAAAPSTIPYVALGDSYAAGTALRDGTTCLRSEIGYPTVLHAESIRIGLPDNVACSGATTSDVLNPQLSALKSDTRLVTLTVGAADLGLSRVLAACSNLSTPQMVQECQGQINRALALLRDCPEDEDPLILDCSLTPLYAQVAEKAPGARIVVTGYPLLFDPPLADNFPFRDINEATTRLNSLIERAVAAANAADVNIHYVDVTEEFAGHGIVDPRACTDDSDFIHTLVSCDPLPPHSDPEAFHPTTAGYQAYADAIKTKLPGGWFDKSLT